MGNSLNEIKSRIASTQKTSHITGAMHMVAVSRLARSETHAKSFQIYTQKIRQITTDLMQAELIKGTTNPMLIEREIKKTAYLIITSDKGLVGSYNSTILRSVMEMIDQDHESPDEYAVLCLGGIGADFLKVRGITPIFELRGLSDHPSFEEVRQIIMTALDMYQNELFDALYVCYTHHINSLTSQVRVEQMLPIAHLDPNEADGYTKTFDLEPDRDTILEQLLPQYAESMIYGAIVDAKTAESAASMTAMQAATDNAKQIISDLTIQYNRARQAGITQEITEIVSGANAIS
ncbi:F-type H+-transporting ATPase subunit gamma [Streptococcus rupicaprae]|uniref:ATP synthase gamma chain n=2 Tax=Streptococcus TaxID=1301 RepID=A0A7X6MZ03_9STRE|nr:F0F1 ATP synthase subunit gamma [Streptococcus ovuberis]NKZ20309.1 F0F1 ATP synthase subunit gamma [Streptococcus ovuberis]